MLSPDKNDTPFHRPDFIFFLPHLYGATGYMISIDTAETDEFIDTTNVVDQSVKFGEFAETLMNESNVEMPDDVTIAFELYLYLLNKIEEYI